MAKDLFHQAVKSALRKDGWTITSDPLILRIDRIKLEIDFAAEKVLAAEKENRKIAVEIKGFINPSASSDFHSALGQFLNYRLGLKLNEQERVLYLAVPIDVFNSFFQERFTQAAVELYQVKIIVYDPNSEGNYSGHGVDRIPSDVYKAPNILIRALICKKNGVLPFNAH